jgi:anthranilate phosphoribosyltransferase
MIGPLLDRVLSRHDLEAPQMERLVGAMLTGELQADDIERLLLALREKGEAVSELVGAARALRARCLPIHSPYDDLLDTCGTGGDGAKTFNISTAAALVAAGAGAHVAKHGNRRITSLTGSADVLQCLGVNVQADRAVVEACLEQAGIGFCFAPLLHPAMAQVAAVRRRIAVPTLFNYLGPLCNPAAAPYQLLGVSRADLQRRMAEALKQLPIRRAAVVRGFDGLDEVTIAAPTELLLVDGGSIKPLTLSASDFGLTAAPLSAVEVDGPEQSAAVISGILDGQLGPARDIVVANAAVGLWLVDPSQSLQQAAERAANAIDHGLARKVLHRLQQLAPATSVP